MRDKIKMQTEENHTLKRELKLKQKTLTTYEYLLKLPAGAELQQVKCRQCEKFCIQKSYLEKHYMNRHADKNFAADYKGYNWVPQEPEE